MFTVMPLVCTDEPGKNSSLTMWYSAKGGWRDRPDSGEAGGGDSRGKVGESSRATRVRSTCSLAAETVPAGGRGGGRRRPPLGV
jgi:hypothetical protein